MSRLSVFAGPVVGLLLLASGAAAQVQPPRRPPGDSLAAPDTLAVDTMAALQDTLAAPPDTTPPPSFRAILGAPPPAVAANVFSWDRDALMLEAALTLGDLLEQVPGVTLLRDGLFLQPEAATAFGQTRGRIEVVLDGFTLDPLTTSTLDLSTLDLAQISELRVERRLDVTRIEITTIEPIYATPYSRLEAGTGEPSGSLLRGVVTSPHLLLGPLAFTVDRVDGDGRSGAEPADIVGVWAKWGWFPNPEHAFQVEYQHGRLRRTAGVPWSGELARTDLMLRARNRLLPGLGTEVFAGRTSIEQPPADTANPDSVSALRREQWQYGASATLRRGIVWADAALRFRDSDALPSRQLDLDGGLEAGRYGRIAGNLTSASWRNGPGAVAYDVRGELGPLAGVTAFAESAGGERGAPLWADSAGVTTLATHVLDSRSGTRFGLSLRRFGIEATGALVKLKPDSAAPFGLPFDSAYGRTYATTAQGMEVFGRAPLWPRGVSVTGNFNYWNKVGGLLYLPSRSWRAALEVHTLPIPSGNLEILARLEHQRREVMLERNPESLDPPDPDNPPSPYLQLPFRNLVNAYLQIRIIDVRAFIHYYDLFGNGREDFLGRPVNGPRILYGVRWQLFN